MIPRPAEIFEQDDGSSSKWPRYLVLFLAVVSGWRLIYLILTPLDLVPDEAYYWDWGRIPALGYYSKPPMIAWINWLTTSLFVHSTPFTVRLPAVVLGTLSLVALYGFVESMFDRKTAFWAVVLAALSPLACAINFVMTTDAPLVCCWSLALYTSWQAVKDKSRKPMWWLLTGLICGIGILSKQMMLFSPF